MNFVRKDVQGEEMVQLARTGFGPQHNFRKNNAPVECVMQSELATASALVSLDSDFDQSSPTPRFFNFLHWLVVNIPDNNLMDGITKVAYTTTIVPLKGML
ncbi:hypothetical protein TNCV_896611 [Trichonephila clavipes]|nr:hypothetical protein TNCV_896611 [Trichonephila clavipes]